MKRFKFCLLISFFCISLHGQIYTPFANSKFAGVYSVCYNPANAAASKFKIHINLVGAGLNANNNFAALNLPYSPYKILNKSVSSKYKNTDGSYRIYENTRLLKLNTPVHGNASLQVLGPSVLFKLGTASVGITTNITALARVNFMDRKLVNAAYYSFESKKNAFDYTKKELANGSNSLTASYSQGVAYYSIGLSLAKEYTLKWNSKLYIGITPKITKGMRFEAIQTSKVTIKSVGLDSLLVSQVNATFFSSNKGKIGRGLDIGIVYEHQTPGPKQSGKYRDNKTQYHSKWGLSILNIGTLTFNTKKVSAKSRGDLLYTSTTVDPLTGNNDTLLLQLARRFGALTVKTETVKVSLPTILNLSADFQLNPKWYVSINWFQSLRSRKSLNSRFQSSIMVTPRVELKKWELGFPLSLMYDYRAPRAGFYVSYSYFHIGSHHILNYANLRNAREIDLFFGLSFGILNKNKKLNVKDKEGNLEKGKGKDKCVEF